MSQLMDKTTPTFFNELKQKLESGLVGESAHKRMIPQGRDLYPKQDEKPRKSAVLIAFYYHDDEIYFPLIKRATNNSSHSGQMALPGGKYEESDTDLIETALREAHEEVGINPSEVEVLGTLTELFIGVTNFSVLPVIGSLSNRPNYLLDKTEVDEVHEVKLSDLLNLENRNCEEWEIRNEKLFVPFYELANAKVWGATAMMLSELESLIIE